MAPPMLEESQKPAVLWYQLSDGTLFNASVGGVNAATHVRLGPLVGSAEDALPGICIVRCGTERPRNVERLPEEEQVAFRAHFLVTDGAGKCLPEDSCHRLAHTLEQTLLACLAPPYRAPAPAFCNNMQEEHGLAGEKGCHQQQQERPEQPLHSKTASDLPSQLGSRQSSASIPSKTLPTALPGSTALQNLSQQSSAQLPLQAAPTGQLSLSGPLSDSSHCLHGSCTSSSSTSLERRASGASPTPTHGQICMSPCQSMAASISSLTAQARGVSREDRFRAAAALWELDMSEIQFHHKLGEGSFGEVLLGSFRGTKVAIKRMHEGQVHQGGQGDDELGVAAQSFEREIETLACIRHPNVVNFFGACHAPPHLCLVTEHCARGSLDQLLHKSGLQINLVRAIEFATDIARGMNCLHEQRPAIIHRDLKTANLLVSARFEIKVADLGLSCVKDQARIASSQAWLEGTVEYSAPEVLRGEPCSEKCDVWSYGVVLHELLTRERPYSDQECSLYLMMIKIGDGTLRLPPVPEKLATPGLVRLVSRCLSMQPGERPSFRDILFHLEPEYKVARGRAPAVPRSGSATSMLESCKLRQQLLRCGNNARMQRQQQQGQQEPAQSKQQSKLPTCSAFDPLPQPDASCCPPAEEQAAAMESKHSSTQLQQLHHATVSSQVSIMPPTRAQPPTPAYNRCPSADFIHSEPVVKMKHRENELQECAQQQQQGQQQQEQQQEDMLRCRQQVLRDHQRSYYGPAPGAHHAGLPRISEESTARSSMDTQRESGSSMDLRITPSWVAQPPIASSLPRSPVSNKQPKGDASCSTSHDAPLSSGSTRASTPQLTASSNATVVSCPAGPSSSPFANTAWPPSPGPSRTSTPQPTAPAEASSPFANATNNTSPAEASSPFTTATNNASPAEASSPFANATNNAVSCPAEASSPFANATNNTCPAEASSPFTTATNNASPAEASSPFANATNNAVSCPAEASAPFVNANNNTSPAEASSPFANANNNTSPAEASSPFVNATNNAVSCPAEAWSPFANANNNASPAEASLANTTPCLAEAWPPSATILCPAAEASSPFANTASSPCSLPCPSDPPQPDKPPLTCSPFDDAASNLAGRRSPQSLFSSHYT